MALHDETRHNQLFLNQRKYAYITTFQSVKGVNKPQSVKVSS